MALGMALSIPSSLRYVLFVGGLGGEGFWLMVGTWELNNMLVWQCNMAQALSPC